MHCKKNVLKLVGLFGLFLPLAFSAKAVEDTIWLKDIKPNYYGNKRIEESSGIVEITAPYRAEDATLVPLQITSKIPQTAERYIKTVTLFIDKNPIPFSAEFQFTPESGRADLAMRVRVNAYTNIRAVAELNDGTLSMHKKFVKASGGCSAPIGSDLEAAMQRMGKMKFRIDEDIKPEQTTLAQLLISHPNITGLQMDQVTRLYTPAHFVEDMKITFNGVPVLTAKTDIAISADPNFRFYFVPDKSGVLKAEIKDNKGNSFSETFEVEI